MTEATKRKRKPRFSRQDSHKKAKLATSWRKPRGLQSKMRLQKRGYALTRSPGYGSPKATRGLVKGREPVLVHTLTELATLDPKRHGVILAATLGARKKAVLLQEATAKELTIINATSQTMQELDADFKERKAVKQKRDATKAAKEKAKAESLEKKAAKEAAKKESANTASDQKEATAPADEKAEAEAAKKKAEAAKQKVLTKKK